MWAAFGAQAAFVVGWIVGGALEPGYSHVEHGVSALGARTASHPWIGVAAQCALGVSLVLLGIALARVLPRRRAVPVLLFALAGAALVFGGFVRLDCGFGIDPGCQDAFEAGRLSWHEDAHLWAGLASEVFLVLTPFALARALWPGTAAMTALVAGSVGLAIGVLSEIGYVGGSVDGLVQRVGLGVLHVWTLIVGVGVLWALRGPARVGPLVAMRPRDFFAQSWRGHGELMLRPFWLGRLFRQRFEAYRDSTWISDRVWRIDDNAVFPGEREERRQTYCEFVSDDHVLLTARDLPDGADVWIEEGGFRLSPFRMAWPLGPLPVYVRCVDRSRVEPDGALVNSFDICTVGLRIPMARITFFVCPADGGTASSPSDAASAVVA